MERGGSASLLGEDRVGSYVPAQRAGKIVTEAKGSVTEVNGIVSETIRAFSEARGKFSLLSSTFSVSGASFSLLRWAFSVLSGRSTSTADMPGAAAEGLSGKVAMEGQSARAGRRLN